MKHLVATIFTVLLSQGCVQLGHQEFYSQVSPTTYPAAEKTMVFSYSNVDLKDVYDLLYSDYLIVGKSSFNGPYEDPNRSRSFAQSIGADVFISSSQFKETRTSFSTITIPTSSTTSFSGFSGGGSFYGTATSYGTRTTSVPISVNRYDQKGFYLRNVRQIEPLWMKTEAHFPKTGVSDLEGTWFNESYKLRVYQSGGQLVAFTAEKPQGNETWNKGELKFGYDTRSGVGLYFMGDRTPTPANFSVNKFGHLEVRLFGGDDSFSFARQGGINSSSVSAAISQRKNSEELSVKGYVPGQKMSACPEHFSSTVGKAMLLCNLGPTTYAGVEATDLAIGIRDEEIIAVTIKLKERGKNASSGVLDAMKEKFGAPDESKIGVDRYKWQQGSLILDFDGNDGSVTLIDVDKSRTILDNHTQKAKGDL